MANIKSERKHERKSKSILINPKFQWTLVGYAAGIATLVLLSVYALISFGFHEFEQLGVQAGFSSDHVYFQFIQLQQGILQRVLLAISVVVGLILVIAGLILSHKIAGPIYRMQKELTSMAGEKPVKLKRIQFRKGDFFPELADSFNQLVEKNKE